MSLLRWMNRSILALTFLFLLFSSTWGDEPAYDTTGCWTNSSATASASGVDTIKAVAIFACKTTASTTAKPVWADSIWDSSLQHSVPRYYKDNSLGKYIMSAVASGRTSTTCWTSTYPVPDPLGGGTDEPSGFPFFEDVMKRADTAINFADFDRDQDDTVDACFFVVVNHSGNSGAWLGLTSWSYKTKDVNSTGDTVIVAPDKLALIRSSQKNRAMSICAHEWGHALFGPNDYYGQSGIGNWGLGAFSIMGYEEGFPQKIAVPVDPLNRIKVGWVVPETVKTPLYQQSIPDYLTTGKVYLLPYSSNQYFYVTNYRGAKFEDNPVAYWQENYSGFGLLIWHVGGPYVGNTGALDVELAHGLWDMHPPTDSFPCKSGIGVETPNPVSGKDSLDCGHKLLGVGYNRNSVQSPSCFWNSLPTNTTFDGKSNPNSNASPNASSGQNISTHLAVRKITTSLTAGSPATADLLVNNWYGPITANTTWGPGAYAITGDITVNSGATLTIQPGTTIYFQRNEDNEGSGSDNTRCEIIVKKNGTLSAIGTSTDSIKFLPSPGTNGQYDWYSVRVDSAGSFKAAYCQFKNSYSGIDYRNTAADTVKNCLFEKNFMHGIITKNGNLKILNNTFKNIVQGYGIYLDSCNATVSGNTVTNVPYGINAYKSSSVVTNNIITTTGDYIAFSGFRREGGSQTTTFSYDSVAGIFDEAAVIANGGLAIEGAKIWPKQPSVYPDPPPQMIGILGLGTAAATVRNSTVKMFASNTTTAPAIKVDGTILLPISDRVG
ncbi:MAG TPA: right-handed parallel beta-helix repeat-containing protein [Verrucomicrobiae bacterium]|nr:right-handed parallel beta-helix repeat-containing protein [Verrucomicrobiae bacterium]